MTTSDEHFIQSRISIVDQAIRKLHVAPCFERAEVWAEGRAALVEYVQKRPDATDEQVFYRVRGAMLNYMGRTWPDQSHAEIPETAVGPAPRLPAEIRLDLERAIAGLTPANRLAIEMRREGFTQQEIASEAGVSQKEVSRRCRSAIEELRGKLAA